MHDLVRPIDRDALRADFQSKKPVPWFCIDNFLQPTFADEVYGSFPSFDQAIKDGRLFQAVNEKGKVQVTDPDKFPPPVRKLHDLLASQEFLSLIEHVTGIPRLLADEKLVGGGIHQTGPRGHLDVHLDFDVIKDRQLFRRLNILVYFNKNWRPEYGGDFELWDPEVRKLQKNFSPVFNRCVMFETNDVSFHGVTAVKCPEGMTRKSFAAYYYTREAPAYYNGTPHDTIFRARPDELIKGKLLMPAEKMKQSMRTAINTMKDKLKGR